MPDLPMSKKLHGYEFYRSIGSPRTVVAPMVDQSELAWRILSRSPLPDSMISPPAPTDALPHASTSRLPVGGAELVYTPMINAKLFANSEGRSKYGEENFNFEFGELELSAHTVCLGTSTECPRVSITLEEEGSHEPLAGTVVSDRPLIVQFCANDPQELLKAARKVQHRCDAVDINFGCPQHIAKRGHYGSFLQDDWDLVFSLINILHLNLDIPVTAKFRVFPEVEKTVEYAKMMERAGASILTCHGRTRDQKGHNTGLADWTKIKAVKEAVKVPVFANGNMLYREDVDRCLEATGCDGVMSAEGNLPNPALFLPSDHPHSYPPSHILASRYLDIVSSLRTPTGSSAIKSHLFRLLHTPLTEHIDLRNHLATLAKPQEFREFVNTLGERMMLEMDKEPITEFPPKSGGVGGLKRLPIWAAQPRVRPLPAGLIPTGQDKNEENAMGDLESGGTGEERVVALTAAVLEAPAQIESKPCLHCANISAHRCPRHTCLIHCRALGAQAASPSLSIDDAVKQAQSGQLSGLACEHHEAKETARREKKGRGKALKNEKRKQRNEKDAAGRLDMKRRKVDEAVDLIEEEMVMV